MKVGVCEATELKKRSEMLSIPFADLLWGSDAACQYVCIP